MPTGKKKRASRTQKQEELRRQAAATEVASDIDVAVVGGGAAGLVAAICAAEKGAQVTVFERSLSLGLTILATGNGRCNFSTVELEAQRYNDEVFVQEVFGEDPLAEILSFFGDAGLTWDLEGPRLYPHSRRASSVVAVLVRRAQQAGVSFALGRSVTSIERTDGDMWQLSYTQEWDRAEQSTLACAVIFSCGSKDEALVSSLSLPYESFSSVLCPVACEDSALTTLDGKRVHAQITLEREGRAFWHERGEVLFRSYGLSGIVVFDLSRRVQAGDCILVDLTPDTTKDELLRLAKGFNEGIKGTLDGVVDPDIAHLLEDLAKSRWTLKEHQQSLSYCAPITDAEALVALVKALPFKAQGPTEAAQAQVKRGGLLTSSFDVATLEAHSLPGLFACGEALNVEGDCGGFNLSWAWKSGMVAGLSAAEKVEHYLAEGAHYA